MSEDLRVTEIEITNFEQIENLTIKPGAVTIISGKNDSGKTSALNAVRSIFDLGHDPAFVRHGAEKAIVTMTLSNGSTLTNTITKDGMKLVVRNADGTVLPKPATLARAMADGVSYDVMKFIRSPKKERAAYLTELMPMSVTSAEILKRIENKAFAPKVAKFLTAPEYDLNALGALTKKCYEDRSLANKDIKRLDGTIDSLRKALPANWKAGDDLSAEVAAAEKTLTDLSQKVVDLNAAVQADLVEFDKDTARRKADVDRWEAAEIDRIRLAATEKRNEIDVADKASRNVVAHDSDAELEELQAKIREATAALATVRQQAKEIDRLRGAAADMERHVKDRKEVQAEADVLTAAMEAIDRAKAARLKETPIPGLSVVGGEVYYHKPGDDEPINFDLHNQATQMELAIKIGMLGSKELPIIVFDGFESFDEEHRRDLVERLGQGDFQVLAGRVTDSPLEVETAA